MGCVEVAGGAGRRVGGVLGAVWICESGVDCGRALELESVDCVELCCGWAGVCAQCVLSGQESTAGDQCDGEEDESDLVGGGRSVTCGLSDCDQDSILRSCESSEEGGWERFEGGRGKVKIMVLRVGLSGFQLHMT